MPAALRFFAIILTAAILAGCGRKESPQIVILVGIDALRPEQVESGGAPQLARLAAEGVRAERMIPSFPTLTFPNFYTLVTGLRPEHHGIVGNSMYDPEFGESFALGSPAVLAGKWWGGEPLWVTAQKQGVRAACMFWPGSEAEIGGVRPWDWRLYDGKVSAATRVQTVLDWLALPAADRPRLITLYFHEVDTAGHRFGPASPEAAAALREVDAAVGMLRAGLRQAGVEGFTNLVCVSDHGMAEVSPERTIVLSELVDERAVQVDFAGAVAGLRPLRGTVDELYSRLTAQAPPQVRIHRREEMPERLHFRAHRRIPPIILIADEGWMLLKRPLLDDEARAKFLRATHGFDPALPSMSASFFAAGPAFKRGVTIPAFENTQIYNLVCTVLGVQPAANDGDQTLASRTLVDPRGHK